jgi:hypothetical protein
MTTETETPIAELPTSRTTLDIPNDAWRESFGIYNQEQSKLRNEHRSATTSRSDARVNGIEPQKPLLVFVEDIANRIKSLIIPAKVPISHSDGLSHPKRNLKRAFVPRQIPENYKPLVCRFLDERMQRFDPVGGIASLHYDDDEENALNRTSIHGSVIEHLNDAVVIRFNVGGESEEREFFWSDLSAKPEALPVGTMVVGETRLLRAPGLANDEEVGREMERIQQGVEEKLKTLGIDPDTPVGLANDDTESQRSTEA